MKTMKFEDVLAKKIDMNKVKVDVLKPWITKRTTEMLKIEDDVVVEFIFNQLEEKVSFTSYDKIASIRDKAGIRSTEFTSVGCESPEILKNGFLLTRLIFMKSFNNRLSAALSFFLWSPTFLWRITTIQLETWILSWGGG